jgi:hypothetical protein
MRRPSPALVISCIALTVALGGTSYATVFQVPRNSVGPLQLKNAAVVNRKIANNAVTSAKVMNGTLVPADFKSSTLPSGPVGPAGPAGPPGLSGVERVEASSPSNSATTRTLAVTCPTGKRLLGGGVRLNPVLAQLAVQQSFPDNDNTYRANVREMNATATNWSITVFAICASAS